MEQDNRQQDRGLSTGCSSFFKEAERNSQSSDKGERDIICPDVAVKESSGQRNECNREKSG